MYTICQGICPVYRPINCIHPVRGLNSSVVHVNISRATDVHRRHARRDQTEGNGRRWTLLDEDAAGCVWWLCVGEIDAITAVQHQPLTVKWMLGTKQFLAIVSITGKVALFHAAMNHQ